MSKVSDDDFLSNALDNFGEEEEINRKLKEAEMFDPRDDKQHRRRLYNVLLQSQLDASPQTLLTNKSNEPNKKSQTLENAADSKDLKEQQKDHGKSSKKKELNSAAQKQKKSGEMKMKNQQQSKSAVPVFQNEFNVVDDEEEAEILSEGEQRASTPSVAQQSISKSQPEWKTLISSHNSDDEFTPESGLGDKLKAASSIKQETSRNSSPGGFKPTILQRDNSQASTNKHESRLPQSTYAAKLLNASTASGKKESEKPMTFEDIVKGTKTPSREKADEEGEASMITRERPTSKVYNFEEENSGQRSESPTATKFPSFSNKMLNNSSKQLPQMRMRQQKMSKEIELISSHIVTEWSVPTKFDYSQMLEKLLQKEEDLKKERKNSLSGRAQWKRPIPLSNFKNIKKLSNTSANSSSSPTPRLDYSPKAGRVGASRSPYQNRDFDDPDIISVAGESGRNSGRNSSNDIFDNADTNMEEGCQCPICGKTFPPKDIEVHAAGCQNFDDVDVLQEIERPNSRAGTRSTRLRRGPGDGGNKARTGITPTTDDEADYVIDSDSDFEAAKGSGSKRNRKKGATTDKRRRL